MWCCVEGMCCIYTHNFVSAVTATVTVVVLMLLLLLLLMFLLSSSSLVTIIHTCYSRFRINICRNFWG